MDYKNKNFKVAFIYRNTKFNKDFVDNLYNGLINSGIDENDIFLDNKPPHLVELCSQHLPSILPFVYQNSNVVVVCFAEGYAESKWCGLEFRSVLDILLEKNGNETFLIKLDDSSLPPPLQNFIFLKKDLVNDIDIIKEVLRRSAINSSQVYKNKKPVLAMSIGPDYEGDKESNIVIDPEIATTIQNYKVESRDWDVFLCYNTKNKKEVYEIANRLIKNGLNPWLDDWFLPKGYNWETSLKKDLFRMKSMVIMLGQEGFGKQQRKEMNEHVQHFLEKNAPVIPIILSNMKSEPQSMLPNTLQKHVWIDFRKSKPNPIKELIDCLNVKSARNGL